ncbi:MAG: response regulator [Dehalococcoidales bacterium]|nr:response regulator [Dehalococcoidales bacterium]
MVQILVVDNEPSLRKIIQTNLSASGYSVNTAENGEEGLKSAERDKPDLILLDIKMPGMSGWDVLKALRSDPDMKQTRVIIMTAFLRETEEENARKMGVGYIAKPFSISELLSEVKKFLGEQHDS